MTIPADKTDHLTRVGVIDIGSNSVRLVIFDGAARSPAFFFNEKVMCGLGEGLRDSGLLNPDGRLRALRALDRFTTIAAQVRVHSLTAVATAAVREAGDGPAFCAEVRARTGLEIEVATGEREARLSAQGVLLGWPTAYGLVCDIGGASMELAELSHGSAAASATSPLGPLHIASDAPPAVQDAYIARHLDTLCARVNGTFDHLFLVGGSWRAIARIHMARCDYPLDVIHEYKVQVTDLIPTLDWLIARQPDELAGVAGVSGDRRQLLPRAARVLRALIDRIMPRIIAFSSYGLREGLLYERMSEPLRRRDPLLEACAWMENTQARFPGFGRVLAEWAGQMFPRADADLRRLILAAALLHDVNWRAHPSLRAEVCFDAATRANLGGLDHKGRVFIGLALMHRYKNSVKGTRAAQLAPLLDEAARRDAAVLGRTLRLGATLSGGSSEALSSCRLILRQSALEVQLQNPDLRYFGETVVGRFRALAEALNLNLILPSDLG